MATFALVRGETILSVPFVVRKLVCTTGQTQGAIAHGGPGVPDEVSWIVTQAGAIAIGLIAKAATTVTLSSNADSATCEVYCRFYRQQSDNGTSIGTS